MADKTKRQIHQEFSFYKRYGVSVEKLKEYAKGRQLDEVAERFDVKSSTIRVWEKKFGFKCTRKRDTSIFDTKNISDEEFIELSKTKTPEELCEHYGISLGVVSSKLSDLGVSAYPKWKRNFQSKFDISFDEVAKKIKEENMSVRDVEEFLGTYYDYARAVKEKVEREEVSD